MPKQLTVRSKQFEPRISQEFTLAIDRPDPRRHLFSTRKIETENLLKDLFSFAMKSEL